MMDIDILSSVRQLRRLIVTLDAIGLPINELLDDDIMSKLIKKRLPQKLLDISSDIHFLLQNIEKSKKYKDIVLKLKKDMS